jgi:hypothetical protein
MKYRLYKGLNKGECLNESTNEIKRALSLIGYPIPKNIPNDGSWSELEHFVVPEEHSTVGLVFVKEYKIAIKTRCNKNAPAGKPIAEIYVEQEPIFHPGVEILGDPHDPILEFALINNKWYVKDE